MKTLKAKIDQELYYVIYGLYIFGFIAIGETHLLNIPFTNMLYETIRMLTAICMLYLTALKFFECHDKKYLAAKFCVLSIMSIILLASYRRSEIQAFLVWFLLTVPAEGKSVKKILDVAWVTVIAGTVLAVVVALLGLIPNVTDHNPAALLNQTEMALGFWHPNTLGACGSLILSLWLARRYQTLAWYDVGGMTLLTFVFYLVTGCKTIVLSAVFMLVLTVAFKVSEKNSVMHLLCKWGVRLLLPACIGLSLFMGFFYDENSAIMALLNKALTGRFWLASLFLKKYPITLLGQYVEVDIPLDNMYIRSLLESGILVFIMVWGLWYIAMNKLFARKEYALTIACCVWVLYGLSEVCTYLVGFNFTMLLIAQLFPEKPGDMYPCPTKGMERSTISAENTIAN